MTNFSSATFEKHSAHDVDCRLGNEVIAVKNVENMLELLQTACLACSPLIPKFSPRLLFAGSKP